MVKSFTTLLKIKPNPTPESVVKSYSRLQSRMDAAFNSLDNLNSFFENAELMKDEKVDVESEQKQASSYYEELLNLQLEMEELHAAFQLTQTSNTPAVQPVTNTVAKPVVRLTALNPPSWNGIKADFYTWKRKFIHIMEEARILDELTQLCYLQNPKMLPSEYQILISDC